MIPIDFRVPDPNCMLGVIQADVVLAPASSALAAELAALATAVVQGQHVLSEARKTGIRRMLKAGGFKAAGRSKPASEYLAQAVARDGALPAINNVVDVNNYISLRHHLPASAVDRAPFGEGIIVRYGADDEAYVFNSVGHEIALRGLLSLCSGEAPAGTPLANPVKDSMRAKLDETTRQIVAVVYASRTCVDPRELREVVDDYASMLAAHCGATAIESVLIRAE